jgi:hypothetical protein
METHQRVPHVRKLSIQCHLLLKIIYKLLQTAVFFVSRNLLPKNYIGANLLPKIM